MLKDSPSVRRRFLDVNLSGMKRSYINSLLEYKNFLKQRNALLKEEDVNLFLLETIEEKMIASQFDISNYRRDLINSIEKRLNTTFNRINRKENVIKVKYISDFTIFKPYEEFKKIAKEKYLNNRENDLRKKISTVGIHRDDFKIYLNNLEVGEFASQGQNRLMVLSLKLTLAQIIKEETKEDPIIVLDDVLSELDDFHQNKMIEELNGYEQVFITSAKDEDIENINKYHVLENLVIRGN
jgi:DNA replication and repair protein RecF